jgi:hypothetical protein
MPVVIASKTRYSGSVTPSNFNVDTTVVEIGAQSDDYMVEGYLDLGALTSGDTVVVKEWIAVDGVNYRTLYTVTFSDPQSDPIIRFPTRQLIYNMKYKVTIAQTSGETLKSFPYGFILEVMGIA